MCSAVWTKHDNSEVKDKILTWPVHYKLMQGAPQSHRPEEDIPGQADDDLVL